MNRYRISAYRNESVKERTFIIEADNPYEMFHKFNFRFPNCTIINYVLIDESKIKSTKFSPAKQRSHFKARLCQIRNNLQSMTDSESPYLTHEEIIQLQRISCKVDNVISKFGMRTMDLKNGGIL